MLPRWRLVLRLIHVMLVMMSILLVNYWGLMKDTGFNMAGIFYLLNNGISIYRLAGGFKAEQSLHIHRNRYRLAGGFKAEQSLHIHSYISALASMLSLSIVVQKFLQESLKDQFLAWKDGCQGCYSVLQACFGVMLLLNCLDIIGVASLIPAAVVDNRRRRVRVALLLGLRVFGGVTGVLIRCGRVLGGFDRLVAWRLGLGTMGVALLTLVLGAFGSMMTATVFWTCLGLGFLETILICASRQKMLAVFVRFRYIFVSMVKIVLVGYLILDHSVTETTGCKVGSACYSCLRECFWVMLVFYILEVFLAVPLLFVHHRRQEIQTIAKCVLVNIFGYILTLSLALSMTQVAIVVGLLLGGSYGPLMTAKCFWLCAIAGFVEMAALMGITDWVGKGLVDNGMSLIGMLQNARLGSILVPVLRMVALSTILSFVDPRNGDLNFIIADMSNCDETCMARGRDLLAIYSRTGFVQGFLSYLSVSSMFLQF